MNLSGYLGNHVAAYTVIQGTAYIVAVVHGHKAFSKGNNRAYMYAQVMYFFFILAAAIDENIFQSWYFIFIHIAGMNGRPAKYTFYYPFFGMNVYPHRRGNQRI